MPKWSGNTPTSIYEIELNTCNLCGANCMFCSRFHGVGNVFWMEDETFDLLLDQLKDVDFKIIQTSGNGETFLNPNYLDQMLRLKRSFKQPRWIYNNFSLMTKERTNFIVKHRLFDKVHVTIDSLIPWIYERSKNLNYRRTFQNLEYFLETNHEIPVTILYNNVRDYYRLCQKVIGKRPHRDVFSDDELEMIDDEFEDIKRYFTSRAELSFCKINPCLWGERLHAPKSNAPCPKIEVIKNVVWVLPDGSICGCCYDKETEVYTNEGWKLFSEITGSELVLTRQANGLAEWSKILAIQKYPYSGEMVSIQSKDVSLLVTEEHKFPLITKTDYSSPYARERNGKYKDGYFWQEARHLKSVGFLPRTFIWNGDESLAKKYSLAFMRLMGWYLSEGTAYRQEYPDKRARKNKQLEQKTRRQNIVAIYQTQGSKHWAEIENDIKEAGFNPVKDTRAWRIYNKELVEYLLPLGKSYNKYIPAELKMLPIAHLNEMLTALIKGDGYVVNDTAYRYYTTSERLARDVQEIAYKCGHYALIKTLKPRVNGLHNSTGKLGKAQYCVYISHSKRMANISIGHLDRSGKISKSHYDDYVYDITVENNHTLWIRRENKCVWGSNCYDDGQDQFILGNIHKEHILDIFYGEKRRLFIKNVENRHYTEYPCTNPLCCAFGGSGIEPK